MAYYRCQPTVQQAVDSILTQTFADLRLVLVNDGDKPPELSAESLADPRLVVLNLEANNGPYYADAVVLAACDTPWFTIHASDDWSEPQRFETLLAASEGYDVVWGGSIHHKRLRFGPREVDFETAATEDVLLHRGSIATGIFRTDAIRRLGRPHPEFRVAYDTMMVHLLCRAHLWRHLPDEFGYHRVWRMDSLTRAPATGMHSPMRTEQRNRRDELWNRCLTRSMSEWPSILAPSEEVAAQVERDAQRLREML
jgi:glycosyltransferase involved in cell wall biosynthesis